MDKCERPEPSIADMRKCANCGEPISVVGGALWHVPSEQAVADRDAAARRFKATVGKGSGIRVTVSGDGNEARLEPSRPVSADGQTSRSQQEKVDGSQRSDPGADRG